MAASVLDICCKPRLGGDDQFGPPVARVGFAPHVSGLFEFVDQGSDDLLVLPDWRGQVDRPAALGVQIGQHGAVPRPDLAVTVTREGLSQRALHSARQQVGQHAEIWVGLIPLASSHVCPSSHS